jgi:predicted DNA-binding ribbon-helix-helix protein
MAMHRTHVFLEDWQYKALQSLAAQEQRSISALVREVLTRYLARDPGVARQRLTAIEGIGADPQASGREHDDFLYGTKRQL